MSEWTRGEWWVDPDGGIIWGACVPGLEGTYGYGYPIAKMYIPHWSTKSNAEEREANAHLMAAAPDLYEALELATNELNIIRARDGAPQHIDWYQGRPLQTSSCTEEWWDELTEKCFATLRKARGEQEDER